MRCLCKGTTMFLPIEARTGMKQQQGRLEVEWNAGSGRSPLLFVVYLAWLQRLCTWDQFFQDIDVAGFDIRTPWDD